MTEFTAGMLILAVNAAGGWTTGWAMSVRRTEPRRSATYLTWLLIEAAAYGEMALGNFAGSFYQSAPARWVVMAFAVICAVAAVGTFLEWLRDRNDGYRRRVRRLIGAKAEALRRRLVETIKARPVRSPVPRPV